MTRSDDTTDAMEEIDPTLPEVVRQFLASGKKLEEIRLHDTGRWTHEGCDFENARVIKLFSRSVQRTEGGTWVLAIGRFTYPIVVEGTGFFVERIDLEDAAAWITLSDATRERLALDTLHYEEGGKLLCTIKEGAYTARFLKPAYYKLLDRVEPDPSGTLTLELYGQRVTLGQLDPA